MTEKYVLPAFDIHRNKVVIDKPTRMLFTFTGTCLDRDFHFPKGIWTLNDYEPRIEIISSRAELEAYIVGWANEVLSIHERTGCITRPRISVDAQNYSFRI